VRRCGGGGTDAGLGWSSGGSPLLVLLMAGVCALLLAGPGRTVTTAYVNDLFIFLDGAHRVVSGQVPNRDFHTALGPLVYYIPAAGLLLSGHLGAAMPVGTALFLLAVAPVMAHVLTSRLTPVIALPFAAFLLLILAVPMNLGEGVTALSFGMFYNRFGWALLATLLVMALPPHGSDRRQRWLDALCAAVLVATLLYLKISYGLVGLAFVAFMLVAAPQRAWAAPALAATAATVLVVEMFWRSSAAHLADIALAGEVSGGVRSLEDLVFAALRHLADYCLFALVVGLALWRTRSLQDFIFYAFCAVAGLLLMVQNSQPWGIITLHAGTVVAAERLLRSAHAQPGPERRPFAAAPPLLVLALLLPTIVHCALALGLHAALAGARAGQPFGPGPLARISLPRLWSSDQYDFSARYLASVQDGARALSRLPSPSHVLVLDFANPFSAGLGLAPPRGDSSWLHWGRNVDDAHHLPPEELFRDVRIVMEPKWGINVEPLRRLYGDHIAAHFDTVRETSDWTLHVARPRPRPDDHELPEAQSAAAGSSLRPAPGGEIAAP
jgi:hypothetical protein